MARAQDPRFGMGSTMDSFADSFTTMDTSASEYQDRRAFHGHGGLLSLVLSTVPCGEGLSLNGCNTIPILWLLLDRGPL